MMAVLTRYSVLNEIIMLIVSVMFLYLIRLIKPSRTRQMRIVVWGFGLSAVAIILNLLFLLQTTLTDNFSKSRLYVSYFVFAMTYICLLELIYSYISFLSYRRRLRPQVTNNIVIFTAIIYIFVVLYPLVTDKLYYLDDGVVTLTPWSYIFLVCGMVDATICWIISLLNRNYVMRIAFIGTMVFIPADVIMLVFQYKFPSLICFSLTYVVPFMLFFLLFHCNKYDDIIGTQDSEALMTFLDLNIKKNRKFVYFYAIYPKLKKTEYEDLKGVIEHGSSHICRRIERVHYKMRLYSQNVYTFMCFCEVKSDKQGDDIANKVKAILTDEFRFKGYRFTPNHKVIVIRDNPRWGNAQRVNSMIGYLVNQFQDVNVNEYIEIDDELLDKFDKRYEAEQLILDIRAKGDLEDDRVICYAQPIFCNETNSFRTAEILMRMQNNGNMIFPDMFIPAAEKNDCIHLLTKIILNKACKQIKKMEGRYDFDAVTVNCSTQELAKEDFFKDIMDIISKNEVDPSKIRLEITESTSITDYENIRKNMETLKKSGVTFYLDDFGTGYSNLERLVTYPFSTIKFDKSILYKALENDKADKLLEILVKFFTKNGIHALVEGVEDDKQNDYAFDKGFEFIQGYKYAKPQPVENLVNYFVKK